MKHQRILIIGLGRFGSALADELWHTHSDTIVVDRNSEAVDAVKSRAGAAFVADASAPGVLESIGARDVDVAVVTSGEDFEATVLCVSLLAELGVKTIFARAASERQARILSAVGATRAIQVENEMGRRLAVQVLNPVAANLLDFASHFRVVPWCAAPPFVGKTLAEAKFRGFGINVLGFFPPQVEDKKGQPRMQVPDASYTVTQGHTLLLVGDDAAVERFFSSFPG
jgi:trk system potassium uptake protein TrkA